MKYTSYACLCLVLVLFGGCSLLAQKDTATQPDSNNSPVNNLPTPEPTIADIEEKTPETNVEIPTETPVQIKDSLPLADVLEDALLFVPKEEEQDTVFYMGYGWVGGMGSAPILAGAFGEGVQKYNDYPIFVEPNSIEPILEKGGGLPACYAGTPRIRVSARISLEQVAAQNTSIMDAPEEIFYRAKVHKLYDVEIEAEACE